MNILSNEKTKIYIYKNVINDIFKVITNKYIFLIVDQNIFSKNKHIFVNLEAKFKQKNKSNEYKYNIYLYDSSQKNRTTQNKIEKVR